MRADLTGRRFAMLTAIEPDLNTPDTVTRWICRCDCGRLTSVRSSNLKSGRLRSCGCYRLQFLRARAFPQTHGLSKSAEWRTWRAIRERCHNENSPHYKRYGGWGIQVCERWRNSFEAFYEDMGQRPSPTHSIDRWPDFRGNYEPGNCRWATRKEQQRNRRSNRPLTLGGKTRLMVEWAELYGVRYGLLKTRLAAGWDLERALTVPPDARFRPRRFPKNSPAAGTL